MKIAITGGKGGTGKSTIATALSHKLAKTKKVLLLDLDVDCPDDDLILGIKTEKVKDVESMIPKFDYKKCVKCGLCSKICREHAIVFVKGNSPFVIPEQCIGCKACKIACPRNAIGERKQKIGEIFTSSEGKFTLISGKMRPGIEESSLVVNAVKKFSEQYEKNYDYVIIDTAAGTHCPVISALLGCDIAIGITESTPLGEHDLGLILKLTKNLKIQTYVIINKSNMGNKKLIENLIRSYRTDIIAEIPYSKSIEISYSGGKPIEHESINQIARKIEQLNLSVFRNKNFKV